MREIKNNIFVLCCFVDVTPAAHEIEEHKQEEIVYSWIGENGEQFKLF